MFTQYLETSNNDIITKNISKPKTLRLSTRMPKIPKKSQRFSNIVTEKVKTQNSNLNTHQHTEVSRKAKLNCGTIRELKEKIEILRGEPVYLYVYHVSVMNYLLQAFGCGVYHSTVYLFENEYSFGFSENKIRSGIYQASNQSKYILKGKYSLNKDRKNIFRFYSRTARKFVPFNRFSRKFLANRELPPVFKKLQSFYILFLTTFIKQSRLSGIC